ncbi:SepM family pheromone-processing serine protease [Parageobacillus thermoglucosidasius]|uniref:SepM family pheromone-processing serine protease n=1 Tax=Parageobacillus thermoglucosidasius TaxID=1426 RepID=UPI002E247413|nr:SepM family pheromone-processing serine protease [Parageobacillus thermoglucosidasius]MED4912255.1 SepM family pheromone-processing serine protease [Parageobacillus thermoglucosidasius]MED4943367.1 SepM family pheromone-processing serine protease [Parageobacillus thermoglucosidasius]MED4983321.1 SepM family pheromone-processing serine protease [Parageobacillus thermoglucosidasius]
MKKRVYVVTFFMGVIVALLLIFIKLPYYVTMPGTAQDLKPLVHVENGDKDEGKLMLTTVKMGRANVVAYLLAHIRSFYELHPLDEIKQEGETDEEYTMRQFQLMEQSKEAAIVVAYKKAGKPVSYKAKGVYVMSVVPHMPAYGRLKVGDRIVEIDGKKMDTSEQMVQYIRTKKKGDHVSITFERGKKKKVETLALMPFPHDPKQIGVGISLATDYDVVTNPPVRVNSEQIGGPSAGLMFSLEIYNQLVDEDITKGHKIAGTGTININGEVGPIGGISQKIVAADKEGAEIFFAPNENGAADSNYREAVKTAKEIGTSMKIVPVDTFDDAVRYLERMK